MLVTSKISIDKLISDNDDVDGRWFLGVILSWHMDFAYPDEWSVIHQSVCSDLLILATPAEVVCSAWNKT